MPILNDLLFIGYGFVLTLELLLGGLAIGLVLGCLLSILRYQGRGVKPITVFISVVRGTPLILQLGLIYFAIPSLVGIKLDVLSAGILAFGLNSTAYIAEILRSGIESLPKGQFEAAQALQIPVWPMWRDIILPQVVRIVLPSLTNETIGLLKETALISTLGGMDIMRRAQSVGAEQFTYFLPLCIAGAYYYCFALLIEHFGRYLEKKGAYVNRS